MIGPIAPILFASILRRRYQSLKKPKSRPKHAPWIVEPPASPATTAYLKRPLGYDDTADFRKLFIRWLASTAASGAWY